MKRLTLAVILGLAATIAQADDFAIIDDIWRSPDPLAQRDHSATGLRRLDANRVAPVGLLLRSH